MIKDVSFFDEPIESDLLLWQIGPYHPVLPAPMKLHLIIDGEMVVDSQISIGYTHKGLEKMMEKRSWPQLIPYCDHLDPEGAFFSELSFCLAVEEIGGIEVPARAEYVRIILLELNRISSHLKFLSHLAVSVGSETVNYYILRDREKLLDLFELISGSRFSPNFFRYGGISKDVTEGFLERVLDVSHLIRIRLKEYNDLLIFNDPFLKRSKGTGILSLDQVEKWGVSGPTARASGLRFDLRHLFPFSGYECFNFSVISALAETGLIGDNFNRIQVRLKEILESLEIIQQVVDQLPEGDYQNQKIDPLAYTPPPGEAYARVESARGTLGCFVVSDGTENPVRVQFRTPTFQALSILPEVLQGQKIEDISLILASLDLSLSEVDR
jgi:NADH-quinone oxidoreductase subunit D